MTRRVLPTPPVPVSVSIRTSGRLSKVFISSRSRSRPTSGVGGGTGRADPGTTVGLARHPPLRLGTAAKRAARSSSASSSASTSERTVCGYGRFLAPRSRSLMPLAVSSALSASSSYVRAAATRSPRKRAPNGASCPRVTSRVHPFSRTYTPFPATKHSSRWCRWSARFTSRPSRSARRTRRAFRRGPRRVHRPPLTVRVGPAVSAEVQALLEELYRLGIILRTKLGC
jgi:hypothetical protein